MQTHLCLISKQPLPNLIPLLIEKPQQAVFLVTPEMKIQASRLSRLLQPRGIKVEEVNIPAYDLETVNGIVEEILRHQTGSSEITLNVTGGTKISAMAAFLAFYTNNRRIIYLDTGSERLLQLSPEEKSITIDNNLIRPKDYLAAYGLTMKSSGAPPAGYNRRRPHLERLARFLSCHHQLLGTFNAALSKQWNERADYCNIQLNSLGDGADELAACLASCEAASIGSGIINIQGEENHFFCQGGWFEEFVFSEVQSLNLKGGAPLINVELKWDEKGSKPTANELDIVFTHKNRLHIISCKTSRQDINNGAPSKHALYELDSLADKAGGLFGRSMLASVRRLSDYDRDRARRMGLEVCDDQDILHIAGQLKTWIQPAARRKSVT